MGGGGGLGLFVGTAGSRAMDPLSGGTLVAAASVGIATDAGGIAVPAEKQQIPAQQWNRDGAVTHLQKSAQVGSIGRCAEYVGNAIEAGGRSLESRFEQ